MRVYHLKMHGKAYNVWDLTSVAVVPLDHSVSVPMPISGSNRSHSPASVPHSNYSATAIAQLLYIQQNHSVLVITEDQSFLWVQLDDDALRMGQKAKHEITCNLEVCGKYAFIFNYLCIYLCMFITIGHLDDVLDIAWLPSSTNGYALAVINNSASLRILDPDYRVLQRMDAHADVILAMDTCVDWYVYIHYVYECESVYICI